MTETPKTVEMPASSSSLSEYERTRALNIERNNARLRALGLISAQEEKISNDLAWKRSTASPLHSETKAAAKKRKLASTTSSQTQTSTVEPKRKSLRVQGKDPEGAPLPEPGTDSNDSASLALLRQRRVEECRQARQLAAVRYAQLTDAEKKAAQENPTATYAHCLKRVRTMTEKALYNRIRAIERATGKHCVVKMGVFKCCLQDEGMWDLAQAASEALERLKALQPPSDE